MSDEAKPWIVVQLCVREFSMIPRWEPENPFRSSLLSGSFLDSASPGLKCDRPDGTGLAFRLAEVLKLEKREEELLAVARPLLGSVSALMRRRFLGRTVFASTLCPTEVMSRDDCRESAMMTRNQAYFRSPGHQHRSNRGRCEGADPICCFESEVRTVHLGAYYVEYGCRQGISLLRSDAS